MPPLRKDVRANAVGDLRGGGLDGFPGQVGVAGRGVDLRMTEQLTDHRQALSERECP